MLSLDLCTFLARLPLDRQFEAQVEEIKTFVSHEILRGIAYQWVSMVDKCKALEEELFVCLFVCFIINVH
jgi:hypothetical protein